MIRAVVFDFGQTLVDSADGFRTAEKETQRKACAALGPAAWEEFLEVYRGIRTRFHARSDFSRKGIARQGFHTIGAAVVPTVTNVNNTSAITVSLPETHGITSNYFIDPASGEEVYMESTTYLQE